MIERLWSWVAHNGLLAFCLLLWGMTLVVAAVAAYISG